MIDYSGLRAGLEDAVRAAGSLLMRYYQQPLTRLYKGDSFATEADLASERFLIAELHKLVPQASIYAEESGRSGNKDSDYTWVVDPLDGTTNFAHGMPYFCVSVALTCGGQPVIGAVYQPVLDELWYAQAGAGAWLNGTKIVLTPPENEKIKLIGAPLLRKIGSEGFDWVSRIAGSGCSLRICGAAALDCAYVAGGKLNGLMLQNIAWWDIAAGVLLIQEAGGVVTDTTGKSVIGPCQAIIAGDTQTQRWLYDQLSMKQ